jgi:hypothetical protein
MKTNTMTMLVGLGLTLAATTAGAADAAPEQAVAATLQRPALVASPVDTMAALPADPLFAAMIQCNVGDIANISLLLAWGAVAMLLALCWSEWAHDQRASRWNNLHRR